MSILSWLGALAFKDIRFLNKNAVLKDELKAEFDKLRVENKALHDERMEVTRNFHVENRERMARIEAIFERSENTHKESTAYINARFAELVNRVEEINANSIERDAEKENRK